MSNPAFVRPNLSAFPNGALRFEFVGGVARAMTGDARPHDRATGDTPG